MANALLVRLRPSGPWRFGPLSGSRETTAILGHSDTVHLALCFAMDRLGLAEQWRDSLNDTEPPVRVSSLCPFAARTLYAVPPKSVWPPTGSPRVRWKAARFVPLAVVGDLLAGRSLREERWEIDFRSECLIAAGAQAPLRVTSRRAAAMDRVTPSSIDPHETACLEFAPNAGLWCVATFRDPEAWATWRLRIEAAFRVLADSGIGGERGQGWGLAEAPEFQPGDFPRLILPEAGDSDSGAYWLLSLFAPADADTVDWNVGAYAFVNRGAVGSLLAQMTEEGSVLHCANAPVGRAVNAASPEQKNPRFRAGYAVAVRLPAATQEEPAS